MTALSDHQRRQRARRVAEAKSIMALAQRYVSTRPNATGSDLIRNMSASLLGLIEELSITGDTKA